MTEIQFGDIEFKGPQPGTPPDEDAHFAVVECGQVHPGEIRIFVDVDVMREMEAHAHSNTNVELGGVMLGGQYYDQHGRPYVIVLDSLRAEHYEATKGSFKFTHDTWQEITRRRERFAKHLEMVGWYHTHPGWGIFLSGMDDFICDHFFNRPLDLALVIDPCRSERGWFIWTNESPARTRRTGGFYLFANRFREDELVYFSSIFSGDKTMAVDPRYSGGGPIVQPVVNINDQRTPVFQIAIMAMLTVQLLVLALLGYKILLDSQLPMQSKVNELSQKLETQGELEKLKAREQSYERAIAILGNPEETNLAKRYVQLELERTEIAHNLLGQMALNRETEKHTASLANDLESHRALLSKRNQDYELAQKKISDLSSEKRNLQDQLDGKIPVTQHWMFYLITAVVGLAGLAGGFWLGARQLFKQSIGTQTENDEDE
ncbi:MAG TPA: Mov34/MPN/PAD-1 family protein [Pirellulaceae bacterium]|nr:Mov34/MPN/PAD-1 family protein [Pirellulaceae bacterium]HMO92338.1 Mov34/MPN/PAD-1 family protein [Pirellulaceae bacterium]HMP69262.1 Mov34/MPN/PAD-1 family protein [Pirellulaceae bacterium]